MIKIPENELLFSFSRSSGSGGQNVNKVNTKTTMSWDIKNSTTLSQSVKERFIKKYKRFITTEDLVLITSQRFRHQKMNRQDCIDKLHKMLSSVEKPPKKRKPTRPKKSAIENRLKEKKQKSEKKSLRQKKYT